MSNLRGKAIKPIILGSIDNSDAYVPRDVGLPKMNRQQTLVWTLSNFKNTLKNVVFANDVKQSNRPIIRPLDCFANARKDGLLTSFVKVAKILLGFISLFGLSQPLLALPEDGKEPLFVHADSADLNQTHHHGTYLGHIALDQGSTHIRAAKAITQGNDKNQLIQATIEGDTTTQAHYWTLQNKDKPVLHAYANTICYCPLAHQIILVGHAQVMQGQNQITAATICYNTLTQHVMTPIHSKEQTVITVRSDEPHTLEPHA